MSTVLLKKPRSTGPRPHMECAPRVVCLGGNSPAQNRKPLAENLNDPSTNPQFQCLARAGLQDLELSGLRSATSSQDRKSENSNAHGVTPVQNYICQSSFITVVCSLATLSATANTADTPIVGCPSIQSRGRLLISVGFATRIWIAFGRPIYEIAETLVPALADPGPRHP